MTRNELLSLTTPLRGDRWRVIGFVSVPALAWFIAGSTLRWEPLSVVALSLLLLMVRIGLRGHLVVTAWLGDVEHQ
jgi:hypothetical protein